LVFCFLRHAKILASSFGVPCSETLPLAEPGFFLPPSSVSDVEHNRYSATYNFNMRRDEQIAHLPTVANAILRHTIPHDSPLFVESIFQMARRGLKWHASNQKEYDAE
jgi:hypothetical protein